MLAHARWRYKDAVAQLNAADKHASVVQWVVADGEDDVRMACAALILALSSVSGRSFAQSSPAFTFPQKIGPAELVATQDFEKQTAGLGQVGQYRFQGWRMSLYVYDKLRKDLADTYHRDQSLAEVEEAAKDVFAAKAQGHYASIEETAPFALPPITTPGTFQCRSFRITMKPKDGAQPSPRDTFESYRCVTTSRKRFVKLILSSETPSGDQATVFTPVAAAIEMTGRLLQR